MFTKFNWLIRGLKKTKKLEIQPPKFVSIEPPRRIGRAGSLAGGVVAVTAVLAGAYWMFSGTDHDGNVNRVVETPRSAVPDTDIEVKNTSQPVNLNQKPLTVPVVPPTASPSGRIEPPPRGVTPNPIPSGESEHDPCEWIAPSTRSDGTYVEGYWWTKPGSTSGCSLVAKSEPVPVVPEKPEVHVGPRGGLYHYSRSGKKVYERRH
jgi:hypothetical protein